MISANATTARTFRKKPIEIQAVQWTGDNTEEVQAFAGAYFEVLTHPDLTEDPEATASLCAAPHSSWVLLYAGDWIVRVGPDKFMRCPDADFRETYEAVGAGAVIDFSSSPINAAAAGANIHITGGPSQGGNPYYGELVRQMQLCQRLHGGIRG